MIYIVLGTKAQLVKMAPVMKSLQDRKTDYCFIHTGQHKETMDEMYLDFNIKKPDIFLYNGADITSIPQIGLWFLKLLWKSVWNKKEIFQKRQNSIVLVHGDTFSTLLGALMGIFARIKVGHVESGLRSFNIFHPFPEELTRLAVLRLSHVLYCPGQWALDNVRKYKAEKIDILANTLHDTVALSQKKMDTNPPEIEYPFALVSLHRYENIFKNDQLTKVVEQLEKIALKHKLLFILHPPTKKQLLKFDLYDRLNCNLNIVCRNRFSHSGFLKILYQSDFVITDGGSLQEETSYLGKPCLLFREATERMEGVGENVILSKFDENVINNFVKNYKEFERNSVELTSSPSDIITEHLRQYS